VAQEVVEAVEAAGQEVVVEVEAKKEEKSQDAVGLSRCYGSTKARSQQGFWLFWFLLRLGLRDTPSVDVLSPVTVHRDCGSE
jgi:hypothetical protein